MIVVDSSAILAALLQEPDGDRHAEILLRSARSMMSAVNVHETAVVLRLRKGRPAMDLLWQMLTIHDIDIIPFDQDQVRAASAAFDRYGKGIDPRARLNLADCAAYALAKTLDVPLLFKGEDFAATDIRSCFK